MSLGHWIPDQYSNSLSYFTNSNSNKLSCPHCFSVCTLENVFYKNCLYDSLFPFSCLFVSAFVSYPEILQQFRNYQLNENCEAQTKCTNNCLMQLACEQSKAKLPLYINLFSSGPIWMVSFFQFKKQNKHFA